MYLGKVGFEDGSSEKLVYNFSPKPEKRRPLRRRLHWRIILKRDLNKYFLRVQTN